MGVGKWLVVEDLWSKEVKVEVQGELVGDDSE